MSIFRLIAGAQSYDWGKIGQDSKVAQYASTCSPSFQLDEKKPYAELWMGTHPSMPSKLASTGEGLKEFLQRDPERFIGKKVLERFSGEEGPDLPFLFKVLAIRKALSIQAHPDKELARTLHQERPDIYKDGNHKPEMAVALTKFSGFCGFLPVERISTFLSGVPEFSALINESIIINFNAAVKTSNENEIRPALKQLFEALMTADEKDVAAQLNHLVERYRTGKAGEVEKEGGLNELVLELNRQYPGDVGVFCAFMLNVVKLEAGQAVFLKANEPHAYIYGDIMECMATSDNVVRAGLTPKLRDVPTLVSMLTYHWGSADSQIMPPRPFKSCSRTTLYDPPIDEFSVLVTDLQASGDEEIHEPIDGPSILIITKGVGRMESEADGTFELTEGVVFFIGAGAAIKLVAGEGGLVIYRAYVEVP